MEKIKKNYFTKVAEKLLFKLSEKNLSEKNLSVEEFIKSFLLDKKEENL
jgi:hypothetical protein